LIQQFGIKHNSPVGASTWYFQPYSLVGGWATPLKNISQFGLSFPTEWKIKFMYKNVPNHQPVGYVGYILEILIYLHNWEDIPKNIIRI
jgi:hypothetical protein